MLSIKNRLQRSLFLTLLCIAIIVLFISRFFLDNSLRSYIAKDLQDDAITLIAAMEKQNNSIILNTQRVPTIYHKPYSGYYFYIEVEGEPWRSRSSWDYVLPLPEKKGTHRKLLPGPKNQLLLIHNGTYKRFGQEIRVYIARDYSPITKIFNHIFLLITGIFSAGILFLIFLQRRVIQSSLQPINNVQQQIIELQSGHRATISTEVPQELTSLTYEINRLLKSTETTLERSRSHLSNLGHALKTPLAVLLSKVNHPDFNQHPELHQVFLDQLHIIQGRISRELTKARLSGEVLPGAYFNVKKEFPDLIATMKMIHGNHLTIEFTCLEDITLPFDREDALEIFGNILDNACKWARSKITISVQTSAAYTHVLIEDDGPGIDSTKLNIAQSRGKRLDETTQGHGLGLTIVSDIINYLNGTIEYSQSPLGGLRVSIQLPHTRVTARQLPHVN